MSAANDRGGVESPPVCGGTIGQEGQHEAPERALGGSGGRSVVAYDAGDGSDYSSSPVLTGVLVRVCGLDLAQSTGWSLFVGESLDSYGLLKLPKSKGPPANLEALVELLQRLKPDRVAVEHIPFVTFPEAHATHWRLRTLLSLAVAEVGLPEPEPVGASKLKRWATGTGKASKAAMVGAARDAYGVDLWAAGEIEGDCAPKAQRKREEDQADAIWVGAWGANLLSEKK